MRPKLLQAWWLLTTVLTTLGTVLMFTGLKAYIPPEEPYWLIFFGIIVLGIGVYIQRKVMK